MTTNANEPWVQGFGAAPARKTSAYIAPGVYRLRLTSIVKLTSRNPSTRGHVLLVLEGRIEETITAFDAAPHPENPAKRGWPDSNKAGEAVAVIYNFSRNTETAMSNVKALLLACLQAVALARGAPPPAEDSLTPAQWEQALVAATAGAGTQFAGLELICYASRTTTRGGDAFTPLRWEPAPRRAA